jgi:hypothetical protein
MQRVCIFPCRATAEGEPQSPMQHCSVGSTIFYIAPSRTLVTHKGVAIHLVTFVGT